MSGESIFDHVRSHRNDERLTQLGAGTVTVAKVTRKGKLKPVTPKELRRTLRERRRKKAEALAAKLPERREKRKLGRGAKKLARKLEPRHRGRKAVFRPYMLMRAAAGESVAIDTAQSREQCRDSARLDRVKRIATGKFLGTEVYTIHLTKKGKLIEQVYPVPPFVKKLKK